MTYNGQTVPGLAEAIVSEEVFAAVQKKLAQTARAPAAGRSEVRYLLQGKAFCGLCGSTMIGECGRSKTGAMYHYYNCSARKNRRACKKANERKDFIEWYVVEQTVQYVLSPNRIELVAKAVADEYKREFNDTRIADLEHAVERMKRDMDKLVDTYIDAPKQARPHLSEKMEALDAQKSDAEVELSKLRLACEIRLSEKEVLAWLRTVCTGDPLEEDFRERIIDTFVNSVYFYDDRIVVFYNIKNGQQTSYIDPIPYDELPADDDNEKGTQSSSLSAHGGA